MYINTDNESFIPKDFVIFNFYGKETCFVWNENEFLCFPYEYKSSTDKLKIFKTPLPIKDIRCFNKRVFILCLPTGIYKLTENLDLAVLSRSGIELGSDFCEVLAIKNDTLILEDKKYKSVSNLIPTSTSDIHSLTLYYENTDINFYKTFLPDDFNQHINLCFISVDSKLFKMFDKEINIFYTCDHLIKNVQSVEKQGKVIGILLQTPTNVVVLIHHVNNKLEFNKIFLETNPVTICAVIDTNIEDELVMIYSDGVKTYYSRKNLNKDSIQEIKIEEKYYESLKLYQSNLVIFLNNNKELFQNHVEQLRNTTNENLNDFVRLELKMLKGLDQIIEKICDKTTELKILNNKMIEKEDVLKRINLFVNKYNIKYCPNEYVKRILNQIFLVSDFQKMLPENSTVVKMLKSKGKTVYSMKNVKDWDTIVEMPIHTTNLSSQLTIKTDLITHRSDGVWCVIKNYIRNPITSKSTKVYLTSDQLNFVKHKLIVLKDLIETNNVTLDALSQIKRDIRQKIPL